MSRLRAHPWLLVWLTAVWVGLWGSVTAANVLGGLAVAVVLVGALPLESAPRSGVLRPLAAVRFFVAFARDLVRSSVQVARKAQSAANLMPRGWMCAWLTPYAADALDPLLP